MATNTFVTPPGQSSGLYTGKIEPTTSGVLTLPTTSGGFITASGSWTSPTYPPPPQASGYSIASDVPYTIGLNTPEPTWEVKLFGDGTLVIRMPGEVNWFRRKACEIVFGSKWRHLRKGLAKQIETALDTTIAQYQQAKSETVT